MASIRGCQTPFLKESQGRARAVFCWPVRRCVSSAPLKESKPSRFICDSEDMSRTGVFTFIHFSKGNQTEKFHISRAWSNSCWSFCDMPATRKASSPWVLKHQLPDSSGIFCQARGRISSCCTNRSFSKRNEAAINTLTEAFSTIKLMLGIRRNIL